MKSIGIVTDSGANLPPVVVKRKGIEVVPLQIAVGPWYYREGVDLQPGEFYGMLETLEEMPAISSPPPRVFWETFEKMKSDGYKGAVCITSSSNLYPVYQIACEARDMVRPFPVVVIDSHMASMSQGFMVLEAEKAASEGLVITEVVERVWKMRRRVHFYALAGMLPYLVQTGRISKVAAFLRAFMNLTPILTFDQEEGTMKRCARARSRQQGINYMLKRIEEDAEKEGGIQVAVLYGGNPDEAERLRETLSQKYGEGNIFTQPITPVIGCQTGPGIIGVSYCVGDPPAVFE